MCVYTEGKTIINVRSSCTSGLARLKAPWSYINICVRIIYYICVCVNVYIYIYVFFFFTTIYSRDFLIAKRVLLLRFKSVCTVMLLLLLLLCVPIFFVSPFNFRRWAVSPMARPIQAEHVYTRRAVYIYRYMVFSVPQTDCT